MRYGDPDLILELRRPKSSMIGGWLAVMYLCSIDLYDFSSARKTINVFGLVLTVFRSSYVYVLTYVVVKVT